MLLCKPFVISSSLRFLHTRETPVSFQNTIPMMPIRVEGHVAVLVTANATAVVRVIATEVVKGVAMVNVTTVAISIVRR